MNRKVRRAEQRKLGKRASPVAQQSRNQTDAAVNPDALASLFAEARRCHRSGQLAQAVARYDRILCADPTLSDVHNNRGAALAKMGRVGDAELAYRRAISTNPDSADAHNNLGSTLCVMGRSDAAEPVIREAIRLRPDWPVCHLNLGMALHLLERLDEAEAAYRHAIVLDPAFAEAHNNLGELLRHRGRLDEAERSLRTAIGLSPRYADAYGNLGNTLRDQNQPAAAEAAYRQAIALSPDSVRAYSNLGSILTDLGRPGEAEQALRHAIALYPDFYEAHVNLGNALLGLKKLAEAESAFRRAIALNPNLAEAHNNLGIVLKFVGRLPEARRAVEQAVHLAPQNTFYHLSLGDLKRFETEDDPHLKALEDLTLNIHSLANKQKMHLHFALAKAYDDIGRCNDAFDHKLAGNALKRQSIAYDEAPHLLVLERVAEVFTRDLIMKKQDCGEQSPLPVFIIGMPRSGSTLIEQILASHPQVFGAGELTNFGDAVTRIANEAGGLFLDVMPDISGESLRQLGARYVAEIAAGAPGAARITDKSLSNFLYAGLIHLALPNARIIHAVRDPIDTCLSCFSKLFASGQHQTYDLAELGRYYRHCQALMQHWHRVLPPGRILDVHHEKVVADLEGQARRIIAHCGLDWDERCLAFHETQRPVLTASAAQVRQPLYREGIDRARPSDAVLRPLLTELFGRQPGLPEDFSFPA
jgi:tetratricopeptide (TPR) repeat protein